MSKSLSPLVLSLAVGLAGGAALLADGGVARAQVAGEAADLLTLSNWAGGFNTVTDIAFLSDGRAIIVTKNGRIAVVGPDGTTIKDPAYAFPDLDATNEKGLLGVVRDDADNVYLYASTGTDSLNKHKVYKGRVAADGTLTVEEKPLVAGGLEGPANHDGGGLEIYKGQLYISVGDTGRNATPPQNMYGACLNKPNGKILRVNLDGSIPADNPLNAVPMVTSCTQPVGQDFAMAPPDKRIYNWGFRNPWRFWTDPETGLMWIGDVGEASEEEITLGGKGTNHGWPFVEGDRRFTAPLGGLKDCKEMTPSTDCVAPQHRYIHDGNPSAASVTGGLIPPKGCGWGVFEQRYFFADYNRNVVWTLDVAADRKSAVPNSRKTVMDIPAPVSFRMGPGGAMYIAAHGPGLVKKVVPKNVPAGCGTNAAPSDGGAGGAGGSGGAAVDAPVATGGAPGGGAGGSGGARADAAGPRSDALGGGSGDDGCSCSIGAGQGGKNGSPAPLVLAFAAAVGAVVRRRSKNRAR